MSKKSQWKLTENGVLALYEQHFRKEVKVQVIFKTEVDTISYLRVSDGKHRSPVVLMMSKFWNGSFTVGSVIAIKERNLVPFDEYAKNGGPQFPMQDNGLHHVYIQRYTVIASHSDVGQILGNVHKDVNYRDDMRRVFSVLTKWIPKDQQLEWEHDSDVNRAREAEADLIREHGNTFFKKNDFVEAIAFYDVAKVEDPYDCRVWSNCSHAHFKLEEYMDAELHAIVAMKLNPFFEKAYYRAGQAALKEKRRCEGEDYAECGIFVCGETKELRQILDDTMRIPFKDTCNDFLDNIISDSIRGIVQNHTKSIINRTMETFESMEIKHCHHQKSRGSFKDTQDLLHKKKHSGLSGALGRENKKENKKSKKSKKPAEGVATTTSSSAGAAGAAAAAEGSGGGSSKKEEEERKYFQDKREEKNKKLKISFEEALQKGNWFFGCYQYHQAIDWYSKCLTYNGLTDSSDHVKPNESYNVQVIQFIIAACKVHINQGSILEGMNTILALLDPSSKFPHKLVCRFMLAMSFDNICCFKLSQKHAQLCKDSLKKSKNIKPIKFPGTVDPIPWTCSDELEVECDNLLQKPSSSKPSPKAKCRYKTCITTQGIPYAKDQIYLRDPDFKGYLNVICEENCTVSYHPCCWKALKEDHDGGINKMSDKDFLGKVCVTPDCTGKISSIQIYDDAGHLKKELVKDKKNMPVPVKQKKKKNKKKEKSQINKKWMRLELLCEEPPTRPPTNEDTSPPSAAAESSSVQSTNTNSNNSNSTNLNKNKFSHKPVLPIDPESLEKAQITILKPTIETEDVSPSKSTKKNKKKKAKKSVNQLNLFGDPLETDLGVQNEYIARLRVLRQQMDALEADKNPNPVKPITVNNEIPKPVMLLDPDNPFYLPQYLRDNPEELENVLQKKLTTTSPPGLDQEAINTLLVFMYDWLKSEGPMHTSDPRLAEQVAESFPQEARDYLSQCGGITGLLMQSIKFAMIDSIICVYDDVMKAQEMMCKEVNEKMARSKYLVRYSDGQKAKRFTHLLDDAKSTCSTASSSSQPVTSTRYPNNYNHYDDPNNNDDDTESNASLAPISKSIVNHFNKFSDCSLNPTAPEFEPHAMNDFEEDEEEEDDETQSSRGDSEYIERWAEDAGDKVAISLNDEEEENEVVDEDEEEEKEEEEEEEEEYQEEEEEYQEEEEEYQEEEEEYQEEEIEHVQEEGEEGILIARVEDDIEATEIYITQLHEDKDKLARNLENEQQQNQVLSDKLYQVKSQYKSEVMKLKQQLEELKDQNKELTTEKNAISLQREAEVKKFKGDLSRMNEELKTTGSRLQSMELKGERCLDHNNELQAKLAEETELNTQLKEELEKMKNLQESLTSCSRRAREAEVKYLCTKKDLVDDSLIRTITRLTEEACAMRQLLPRVKDHSLPDRTTLTRTIVAWDEAIKNLREQQRIFKEESTRQLGMIHQGRPLSALPLGDLVIPAIPHLTIAPLLNLIQNNHSKPLLPVPEGLSKDLSRHIQPDTQRPPPKLPPSLFPPGAFNGHPMFVPNGGLPLNHPSAYASGAIPKSAGGPPPGIPPCQTSEIPCLTQQTDKPNQLFVGQLPWEYTDTDVKNVFSRYGEVVSANVFDKSCNADGRPVPKYGFVTFRNADDCFKALSARPIFVHNHMLNVQAKEPKKPTKPSSVPAAGGGGGIVGGEGVGVVGGGGGLAGLTNEPDATNGTQSSAYGLTNITVNANAEANKSAAAHHHTLTTSPTLHLHQPPPPTTQSVTKPKFQAVVRLREGLAEYQSGTTHAKLLPSNNPGGGIVAPPPKLVRPQGKTMPNSSKLGGQTSTAKEENVMPSSSSYTRLIEICKHRFGKEFTSPDICIALREVRIQNNNSLSGLNTDRIVERVRQQLRSRRPGAGAATVAPWAGITQGKGVKTAPEWQGPNKDEVVKEEQCSICLEPLNTSPNQSLACLHTFHVLCINDWIKIQSNCPNCRKFALMPDEYPTLSHN